MKRIVTFCVLMVTTIVSYGQNEDNLELIEIYKTDQGDRSGSGMSKKDWKYITKRDKARQVRVYELLDSNKVNTSLDYHNAAMIFQHGGDTISSTMTISLMKKSIDLDSTANKWLLAAAIDRDLMYKKSPQIYGTQYRKPSGEDWVLYDIDTTIITDAERIEYNVETLAQQREKVKKMNKKSISEFFVDDKNIDDFIEYCKITIENKEESEYDLSEAGLNNFGYQLMADGKNNDALLIFELNVELLPNSYNAYDSLGECLLALNQTKKGIEAYKKTLELNPKNKNAERIIKNHE